MVYDELLKYLQGSVSDGLVIIVGSGLSARHGLPTMWELTDYLRSHVPTRAKVEWENQWAEVSSLLTSGQNLESALANTALHSGLQSLIVELTAELVHKAEISVIERVISGHDIMPFTRLLDHVMFPPLGLPVITTNYDRLIEVAAEVGNRGADTMFIGYGFGHFDPGLSKESFLKNTVFRKTAIQKQYRKKINLFKPHGSLDWYQHDGRPIRCPFPIKLPRLMVTPGGSKFQKGYTPPFDRHREKANDAIDKAARFLILGYGFNDEHLEPYLRSKLESGTPALILTKQLSVNAEAIVSRCNILALTDIDPYDKPATMVTWKGEQQMIENKNLWDLEEFVTEVFQQ